MDKLEEKIREILKNDLSFRYVGGTSPETGNPLKYIDFMRATQELKSLLSQELAKTIAQERAEIMKWAEEKRKNLVPKNDDVCNCNPRCHDSGKDDVINTLERMKHEPRTSKRTN